MAAAKGNKYAKNSKNKRGKDKIARDLKDRVVSVWDKLEKSKKSLLVEAKKDPKWFYVNFVKPMLPKDVMVASDPDNPLQITVITRQIKK